MKDQDKVYKLHMYWASLTDEEKELFEELKKPDSREKYSLEHLKFSIDEQRGTTINFGGLGKCPTCGR